MKETKYVFLNYCFSSYIYNLCISCGRSRTTGLAENEESCEENDVHQTENLDDADYCLVPEKPIYTKGVAGSNMLFF